MKIFDQVLQQCSNVHPLAQGGQKQVLSATHPDYGEVVIKHGEYRFSAGLERITREVELLSRIASEYYPKHFEFLLDPMHREFLIIEELLEGDELTNVKTRFASDAEILTLLTKLIDALEIVWGQNVVHRDIKPANILVTAGNDPRIIDLGIARFLEATSLTESLAGRGPGTPIYAAPEQLTNRKMMINIRTDFFLLGILILELMHGFHPFDPQHIGNQGSLVDNILKGVYVGPGEKRDTRLTGFVQRALQTQPYRRFRTVESIKSFLGI